MARSRSFPISTHNSSLSSPFSPHSDCISSYSDSNSSVEPVKLDNKPYLPIISSKVNEDTIFSFAWSETESDRPCSMSVPVAQIVDVKKKKTFDEENRHKPPTLPPTLFWSTVVHDDVFDEYIQAEGLGCEVRN